MGEAIYNHGYSMMDDLVGHKSFFQVLVLNITGRLPDSKLGQWLEASFICLSWPDPRIWCNKIAAYAGTARITPVAAASIGSLAADSRMYGAGAIRKGTEFITQALHDYNNGVSIKTIIDTELQKNTRGSKDKAVIMGYARPLATGDERVVAMERVRVQLGFNVAPHLDLAFKIEEQLSVSYNESMNMLGYCVAFMSDHDFTIDEIERIYSLWVNSGVHACYAEYRDRPAGTFLPLRCDDIEYLGHEARSLPTENE